MMCFQIEGRSVKPGVYTLTDVTTYYHMWLQSQTLIESCLQYELPGWITIGKGQPRIQT